MYALCKFETHCHPSFLMFKMIIMRLTVLSIHLACVIGSVLIQEDVSI